MPVLPSEVIDVFEAARASPTIEDATEAIGNGLAALINRDGGGGGSGYAPYVHTQGSASLVWVASNPFGRPCAVELIDSAGNEFEASIAHDAPAYTTVTATLKTATSGRMILT